MPPDRQGPGREEGLLIFKALSKGNQRNCTSGSKRTTSTWMPWKLVAESLNYSGELGKEFSAAGAEGWIHSVSGVAEWEKMNELREQLGLEEEYH